MFSIERVVVLLTPIFAAAASWFVALIANNVPGAPGLDASSVRDVEIAAFIGVVSVVIKWLHGRQKPELIGHPLQPLTLGRVVREGTAVGDSPQA